jgi:hypothetical protein
MFSETYFIHVQGMHRHVSMRSQTCPWAFECQAVFCRLYLLRLVSSIWIHLPRIWAFSVKKQVSHWIEDVSISCLKVKPISVYDWISYIVRVSISGSATSSMYIRIIRLSTGTQFASHCCPLLILYFTVSSPTLFPVLRKLTVSILSFEVLTDNSNECLNSLMMETGNW